MSRKGVGRNPEKRRPYCWQIMKYERGENERRFFSMNDSII